MLHRSLFWGAGVCLVLLLSLVSLAAEITVNTGGKAMTVETSQIEVTIGETGSAVFTCEDVEYLSESGEPQIPWKAVKVLLPPNADLATVSCSIVSAEYETVDGAWDVAPAGPILTRDEEGNEIEIWPVGKTIVDGRDTDIYLADVLWPPETVQLTGTGKLRRWILAEIAIPLVRYNPVSGELQRLVYAEMSINFDNKSIARNAFAHSTARGKRRGYDRVKKLAMNFEDAVVVYEAADGNTAIIQEDTFTVDDGIVPLSPTGTSGYVIITTNDIRANSTKLADFVTHKQSMGFTVTVIDEDDTGATVVGDSAATKLREWLQANYSAMDLKYALIIGDPRPDEDYVPMKLYPCDGRNIPTDYFYAELTCDWDKDNDGIIGEKGDDATSGDEIERYFEVYVGRIPYYGVIADTDAILQKTIDYETATDTDWRYKTLISNVPLDSNMHGYDWGEQVKADLLEPDAVLSDRVYRDGYGHTVTDYDIVPSPEFPASAYPATVWSQGQYGLHIWSTHGWAKGASGIISSGDTPNLNDNYPSTVFQGSCENAYPYYSDNLSYSLLKNGGIVTLGATRNSYYYVQHEFSNSPTDCGLSYRYAKGIVEGKSCGEALWDMKEEISSWWTHNWTLFNPYGDPSVVVMGDPPDFQVTPTDCFYVKQYAGLTVRLESRTYTLLNNSASTLNWTASKALNWFDISIDSGSIPSGGSANVKVTLNAEIENLALGVHSDTIIFTDTTNNTTILCDVKYDFLLSRIPQSVMSLHYVDSEETRVEDGSAVNAFDGDNATIWHTQWGGSSPQHPHEIQIDLGSSYNIPGFAYLPRQDGPNGRIANYEFYVSEDASDWGTAVATGTFDNVIDEQDVFFSVITGRYIRLVALSEVNDNSWTSVAELNVYCYPKGALMETFTNISGSAVSDLTDNAKYPDNPDKVTIETDFEAPTDRLDNYGVRMFAWLIPPATGSYTFWIASDDNGELRLSSNYDPVNLSLIASVPHYTSSRQWDKYPEQQSITIDLIAGQSYYIEALLKEGGGGDNLAVAWQGPGILQQVIPNAYITPYYVEPVIFTEDTFTKASAFESIDYADSLTDTVVSGSNVNFSKLAGPSWLDVAADGTLSGIAGNAAVGVNYFTIRATLGDGAYADATLQITVHNTFTGELGLFDFAGLAEYWLASGCVDVPACGGADLVGDNAVGVDDLQKFALMWLDDNGNNGLDGHWTFDADASDAASNNDGTFVGDATVSSGSLLLDGDVDYVEMSGYAGVVGQASRTVIAWIKTMAVEAEILTWGDVSYVGGAWIMRTSADGLLRVEVSGGKVIGTTPVNDGQWHHVAAVLVDDGTPNVSEVKLYVDGQLESYSVQGSQSIDTGSVSPVRVGICVEQGESRYFDGLVDDVRIYDRAMTDDEVLKLYND